MSDNVSWLKDWQKFYQGQLPKRANKFGLCVSELEALHKLADDLIAFEITTPKGVALRIAKLKDRAKELRK